MTSEKMNDWVARVLGVAVAKPGTAARDRAACTSGRCRAMTRPRGMR